MAGAGESQNLDIPRSGYADAIFLPLLREACRYCGPRGGRRIGNAVQAHREVSKELSDEQPARINIVDRIVRTVRVQVQGLPLDCRPTN